MSGIPHSGWFCRRVSASLSIAKSFGVESVFIPKCLYSLWSIFPFVATTMETLALVPWILLTS
ncbi:hypothetical protein C5B42_00235 [Candidatus Cerribacteria bacterium 'Amazon FNV 2010 28 9']|uniref:Uncharacterized protein n=1 Tax=Candidatus Cerribacteria bacterium 'Amazon FNV 2010 28 9' TaxID=2081795 RepID=A0A317JR29_9BACT|nr:MAG: hypothetical protein C5B42_00235 [Candidatus Cerribacteria bacterium 'Amazon FNV 2010 28 9']